MTFAGTKRGQYTKAGPRIGPLMLCSWRQINHSGGPARQTRPKIIRQTVSRLKRDKT